MKESERDPRFRCVGRAHVSMLFSRVGIYGSDEREWQAVSVCPPASGCWAAGWNPVKEAHGGGMRRCKVARERTMRQVAGSDVRN